MAGAGAGVVKNNGALEDARRDALTHVSEAKSGLEALDLPAGQRRLLELVADGVVERYS